jgi:hypothetical protein
MDPIRHTDETRDHASGNKPFVREFRHPAKIGPSNLNTDALCLFLRAVNTRTTYWKAAGSLPLRKKEPLMLTQFEIQSPCGRDASQF